MWINHQCIYSQDFAYNYFVKNHFERQTIFSERNLDGPNVQK